MKNQRIGEATNKELKRNLAIGFASGLMATVVIEFSNFILDLFDIPNDTVCCKGLVFFLKIGLVASGLWFGLREIGKMDFRD
ncbi:MAG: hypothetical protein DLD55_03760 [candidate division SR1 bacterium]|nr:MAG: hypothetical protein DLD55_03760 [candidate division SR1 bacterium]